LILVSPVRTRTAGAAWPLFALLGLGACGDDEPAGPPDAAVADAAIADAAASDTPAACFAADGGDWTPSIPIETSGCLMRPLGTCGSVAASPEVRLGQQLLGFAVQHCQLGTYTVVEVAFAAGCPSGMRLKDLASRPIPAGLGPCLVGALATERWDCAAALPCATAEHDTLP
jgi:hypothetical protein